MRDSVKAAFNRFTDAFEGHTDFMYLDVLGWATTGRGNLIDPIELAINLPWLKADGTPASKGQITDEWNTIKALQSIRQRGGFAYKPYTTLHLAEDAIDTLCLQKVAANENALRKVFPAYDSWPADAQLGLLSMAWAMGTGFRFPNFTAAANRGDWQTAAEQCRMRTDGNPGVAPRNTANAKLFFNAELVTAYALDPSVLYYPNSPAHPTTGG
jgi:GH24 family phage-related lysozyme (muramidase)